MPAAGASPFPLAKFCGRDLVQLMLLETVLPINNGWLVAAGMGADSERFYIPD